jgi:CubicO group peptidase (beta-lactamase class C family)
MTSPTQAIAATFLDTWLAAQQQRLGIVGIAGGFVLPDGQVVTAAHGLADRERDVAMTVATPFRMASITKVFTVTAMLIARDEGLLSLDAPASELVPELATVVDPAADPRPITLRQLVSHTAGLPHDLPYGVRYWDREGGATSFPPAHEAREWLRDLQLIAPPMTAYHYSNVGFMIVGLALEAAFGQPYEDVVRSRILAPLGMDDSFFWSSEHLDRLSRGYRTDGRAVVRAPDMDIGWDTAGGGLCCSVEDLLRFARLNLGDEPVGGAQVVGGASIREARRPVYVAPDWSGGIGLGWNLRRVGAHTTVAHAGGVGGFSTYLVLVPELRLAATLLSNTNRVHVASLLQAMVSAITEALQAEQDVARRYQRTPPPSGAERFVGHYANCEMTYDVVAVGGRIGLVAFGELDRVAWLQPTGDDGRFVGGEGSAAGEPVVFDDLRDGRFAEFMLQGQAYQRVEEH